MAQLGTGFCISPSQMRISSCRQAYMYTYGSPWVLLLPKLLPIVSELGQMACLGFRMLVYTCALPRRGASLFVKAEASVR